MRLTTCAVVGLVDLLQFVSAKTTAGLPTSSHGAVTATQASPPPPSCTTTIWVRPDTARFMYQTTRYEGTTTTTLTVPCGGCVLESQTELGRHYSSIDRHLMVLVSYPSEASTWVCQQTAAATTKVTGTRRTG